VDKYLSNEFPIHSYKLKNRLIKEGIFNAICSSCKLDEWLGKPIALELDHINGNSSNNNLDNLRLLCPNCHAQTDTYRGKNIGKNI
jgi:5-methylcytosine-specific restriction endonuclease McrA